jgi:hypothetical protein
MVEQLSSVVEDHHVFFSAVAHLNRAMVASPNAFPNIVKISRVVHVGCDDVVVADHVVRWRFVYFWVVVLVRASAIKLVLLLINLIQ